MQEDLADEKTVIFVAATYGEGEPTDNAKDFYAWLMHDDREPGLLERVNFTVFGCVAPPPAPSPAPYRPLPPPIAPSRPLPPSPAPSKRRLT